MSIGVRLKEVRESKGVMQKFVEERMNQYSGWLSRIESGKQDILAKELIAVAEILSVDLNVFFLHIDVSNSDKNHNQPA